MTVTASNSGRMNSEQAGPVFGKKAWTKPPRAAISEQNSMSSPLTVFGRLLLTGLAAAFPALGFAQSLPSPEVSLSGALPGDQAWPGLSLGSAGGCVIWQDNRVGWGLAARQLDSEGQALGEPFHVVATAGGNPEKPQVVTLNGGGAAFVWQSGPVGFQNVYARFMGADGVFPDGEVLVSKALYAAKNSSTVKWPVVRNNRVTVRRFRLVQDITHRRDFNAAPVVSALNNGNVAVAYASYVRYTTNEPALSGLISQRGTVWLTNSVIVPRTRVLDNMQEVFVRLFTPGGAPLGDGFIANHFSKYNQRNPSLAALPNGNFVVAWVSENQGLSDAAVSGGESRVDVYARLFNASGLPLTDDLLVNENAQTENGSPAVAALAGGGFRLAWAQRNAVPGDGWDIVTRSFDALGTAASATVRVNTQTYGDQYAPKIASCSAGEIIVWTSLGQDGSREGVYGQWMVNGSMSGGEFRVNTATAGSQHQPAVAASPGNRVLVGWTGLSLGYGFDVFGQSY